MEDRLYNSSNEQRSSRKNFIFRNKVREKPNSRTVVYREH